MNGLVTFQTDETGAQIGEEINILKTFDEYVAFLHSRNRNLKNFAKRRVRY